MDVETTSMLTHETVVFARQWVILITSLWEVFGRREVARKRGTNNEEVSEMSRKIIVIRLAITCGLLLLFFAGAMADTWQQDYRRNTTGQTATNLEKWLEGNIIIKDWTHMDWNIQKFHNFQPIYIAPDNVTKLMWDNGTVANGEWTCAGFWTVQDSVVYWALPRWTFTSTDSLVAGPIFSTSFYKLSPTIVRFVLGNTPEDGENIIIDRFQVGTAPMPLSFCHLRNDSLSLYVGSWSDSLINEVLPAHGSLVYEVNLPQGGAVVWMAWAHLASDPTNIAQCSGQYVPSTSIPTLTEWGLIIFGVLLLGFISWVFLKKRRRVIGVRT
jgi:hypothetical protein